MGGILHVIGKIIILLNFPEDIKKIIDKIKENKLLMKVKQKENYSDLIMLTLLLYCREMAFPERARLQYKSSSYIRTISSFTVK
jgi:uncharacterized protein YkvS